MGMKWLYSSLSGVGISTRSIQQIYIKQEDNSFSVLVHYVCDEGRFTALTYRDNIPTREEANEIAKEACKKIWGDDVKTSRKNYRPYNDTINNSSSKEV